MACWLYEAILFFATLLVATLVFSIVTQMRSGIHQARPLLIVFLLVVGALYFSWFWSKGRQSLPMRAWRIRIVDRAGRPLTQGRALLRYVYCSLWFAPVIAVFAGRSGWHVAEVVVLWAGWVAVWALLSRFHPQRQFLHDALAGTRLVSA